MYEYKFTRGGNFKDAALIRELVFVKEQGFANEFDEIDSLSWHLTVYDNGKPVAAARMYQKQADCYYLGRIAVLKEYRGKGLGRLVVNEMLKKLKEMGIKNAELSAQVQAQGFYEKLGFAAFGETYLDEHCPHIHMKKEL